MIQVQIFDTTGRATEESPLTAGVCGRCLKCGKESSAPISCEGRPNGPVAKRKAAINDVLRHLETLCESPSPWGMVQPHYDRAIPTGVNVYILDPASGFHFPVFMMEGKLTGIWGGVHPEKGVPIVVPDSPKYDTAAQEFRVVLVKKGYRLTTLARPADIKLRPKTEKV